MSKIPSMCVLISALAVAPVSVAAPAADAPRPDARAMSTNPVPYLEESDRVRIDWSTGVLTVTGYGSPGDRGPASHRRDAADKAARQDARRILTEAVDNLRLDSARRIKDFLLEDDAHQAALLNVLDRAEASALNHWPDGGSECELRLTLVGAGSISALLAPEPAPSTNPSPLASATVAPPIDLTQYSAVIVEAAGLGAQAALRPNLLGADGKVLALPNVGAKYLRAGADMDIDAGLNPLVLKASGTRGALRTDLLLSLAASRTLTRALTEKRLSPTAILLIQL